MKKRFNFRIEFKRPRVHMDKDSVWKWVLLGVAGLIGLGANYFDTRVKDKMYEQKLDQKIDAQVKRLMAEQDK